MKFVGFLVILPKISSFCVMCIVKIKDKSFRVSIPEAEIKSRVKAVAEQINKDFEGKNPLFLCVLNGSFVFAADLYREITVQSTISFVKLASYQGTTSTGKVHEVIGLNENISGRHIIIVEDIVDTGRTMRRWVPVTRSRCISVHCLSSRISWRNRLTWSMWHLVFLMTLL